jgi:hypothetical protein
VPPGPGDDAAADVNAILLPYLESMLGSAAGSDCAAVAVLSATVTPALGALQVGHADSSSGSNSSDCRTGRHYADCAAEAAAASDASIQQQQPQADLLPERVLQQLGCEVILVTPDGHTLSAWPSEQHDSPRSVISDAALSNVHNSSQPGSGTAPGDLRHVQGSVGQAAGPPQVLALPALLEQRASGNPRARCEPVGVWGSCMGVSVAVSMRPGQWLHSQQRLAVVCWGALCLEHKWAGHVVLY